MIKFRLFLAGETLLVFARGGEGEIFVMTVSSLGNFPQDRKR